MDYAELVSTLALVTAVGALAWNIVRDFISDQTKIELGMVFGEKGNIKDSNTDVFAAAGSLIPTHKFDNPKLVVSVINTGRRSVGVHGVGGEKRDGSQFSIMIEGLPKMLQPYEVFTSVGNARMDFITNIEANEIKDLWVSDTKGKKWELSTEGWRRIKKTANYIASGKHK